MPIWSQTADALRRLHSMTAEDQQHVFVNRHGQPLTRDGVAYILTKHASAAAQDRPTMARDPSRHTLSGTAVNAALDDAGGCGRLHDAVPALVGVFGTARDDHSELRRGHVEPLGYILTDHHPLSPSQPARTSGSMITSTRSRWGAKPLRGRGARLVFDGPAALSTCALMAGFVLVEDEGVLLLAQ